MDFTKNEFAKYFSNKATLDLLTILENRNDYNPLAIEAIVDEMQERGLSENDIWDYRQKQIVDADTALRNEKFNDITLVQKIFLFFIPLWNLWYYRMYYGAWKKEGSYLKIKTARFFTLSGLAATFVSMVISSIFKSDYLGLIVLIIAFSVAIFHDYKKTMARQREFDEIYK